jgi:geranylgeranyl diphosphate synthase type I
VDDVAAAWVLLYTAAHIMDSVEDGDPPEEWWADFGESGAINVAIGLYAVSSIALDNLRRTGPPEAAASITEGFCQAMLQMGGGQHGDLTRDEPSPSECLKIAESKSGAFFALACWSGARLATPDPQIVSHYESYGRHLGILIQINDDIDGVWGTDLARSDLRRPTRWTLPTAYAMAVGSPEQRSALHSCMSAARRDPQAVIGARNLIEDTGAALFLATIATKHTALATDALEKAHSASPAREALKALLDDHLPRLKPGNRAYAQT